MDVYLNTRRELLVVKKGCSIPAVAAAGSWRKRKRVVRVSEEIESAVQTRGYYMRKRTSGRTGMQDYTCRYTYDGFPKCA